MPENISTYQPETLVEEIKHGQHPELIALVSDGYGTLVTDATERLEKAVQEYDFPGRARIFVFRDPVSGEIVGSFTAIVWKNSDEDKRGKLLRDYLKQQELNLDDENLAFDVGGIVVNSDHRGQGIGPQLVHEAAMQLHPVFVVGQTKNPSAVIARIKALEADYVLVYGGNVVSEPKPVNAAQIATFATNAYFYSRQIRRIEELSDEEQQTEQHVYRGAVHVSKPHLVPSDKVDLTKVPADLRPTFEEINKIQDELDKKGVDLVAWSPLVAIRKDMVEKIKPSVNI